jgi:hypothetical protein
MIRGRFPRGRVNGYDNNNYLKYNMSHGPMLHLTSNVRSLEHAFDPAGIPALEGPNPEKVPQRLARFATFGPATFSATFGPIPLKIRYPERDTLERMPQKINARLRDYKNCKSGLIYYNCMILYG